MVAREITSPANPKVKSLAKLKDRRGREKAQRFLIEGARELGRAIDAGIPVEEIVYAPRLASDAAGRIVAETTSVTTVAEAPFHKLTMRQNPDGIIGVAATWRRSLDDITLGLVLIVEAIEKPGNLGAMLRTADAAGAAVVVADPSVDPFNPNVVRASQGSLFAVPFVVAGAADAAAWAAGRGAVIVTTPDAPTSLWDADLTGPVAIVVGSEHSGVTDTWREVGTPVRIPMEGSADSLNASVAAAVLLYEAVRQQS